MSDTIFHIEGGLGKNIVATSVIRSYKKAHTNNIIVTTAYPDVFKGNPYINRVYSFGNTPYFYEDYIHEKSPIIFAHDPYKTTDHITKIKPIVETWCDMIGVEYDGSPPELYFNFRELEIVKNIIPQTNKPILIFQPFGGPINQNIPYSWMRDIHPSVAQEIVNQLSTKYTILHVCYPHHPTLNDVIRYDKIENKKNLISLLKLSSKRILIDSSLQHAATAMKLPSTVVWIGTQPEIFGYDIHTNITPPVTFPKGTIDSYLYDYTFHGLVNECPYTSINEIFNLEKIINTIV